MDSLVVPLDRRRTCHNQAVIRDAVFLPQTPFLIGIDGLEPTAIYAIGDEPHFCWRQAGCNGIVHPDFIDLLSEVEALAKTWRRGRPVAEKQSVLKPKKPSKAREHIAHIEFTEVNDVVMLSD
jgi:hypothetical protein